jgi:predicted anti-sigma-YlaC factor YlaD
MTARPDMHLTDEQLDDYTDGVLGDAERVGVERHLASCDQCRRALGDTREVLAWATRERATVTAPSELWPLVASSTIHLAEVRRAVIRSMRGLLVAGALAVAAATAVLTWKIARWTAPTRDVPARTAPARVGGPGRHAGHPVAPIPPKPPTPPKAPELPR